ncbi:hypothetical protein CEQ21_13680 [Niallia circulans]|uniref:Lipoprotein n=1 Tax=Niallia circulans TaxID=1397 RepID=A0A553SHV1_NIACI|nr:hypothetical protein [Niallia circulans]TRZ36568.1 hypothetical protein CEQ21_13680 [Niallia circulans]
MKIFPIMVTGSLLFLTSCNANEQANNDKVSADSNQVQAEQTTNKPAASQDNANSDLIADVKNQLKMQEAVLPQTVPVATGNYLAANIDENTEESYSVRFYSSETKKDINDPSLTSNENAQPLVKFSANVNNETSNSFPSFNEKDIPEDMSVDLGYGIKGMVEGAAGSTYLQWKEGRWVLQVKTVSADNQDIEAIGKEMVEYLESHSLPAPKDNGFVEVSYPAGENHAETRITWEDGDNIYALSSTGEPVDALGMAVSVE